MKMNNVALRSLLLLLTGLQLGTAQTSLGELKFEKESVFVVISAPEATRSPTPEEFNKAGSIFIKKWDEKLKALYAVDTEREYVRIEARVDIERCLFQEDNPELGTWIRLYFKDVAIVFTEDSVPIPEKQACLYPLYEMIQELPLLTGTPFEESVPKSGCCIRPWTPSDTTAMDVTALDTTPMNTTALNIPTTMDTTTIQTTSNSGGGGGDPHFKTWSGIKYDFHGECDLVLLDNPSFANGLGISIHIRTQRERFFSEIAAAAIRIGIETFEFRNRDEWLLNGKRITSKKIDISGYKISRFPKAVSVRLDDTAKINAKIDLIMRNSGMMYVVVDGGSTEVFKGSLGMIGDWQTGFMMSRDGNATIEDAHSFAREWQVREELDGKIFANDRAPQYPASCLMPKKLNLRAGNKKLRDAAEKKCRSWGEDKDNCIFDVMATGDISAAQDPVKFSGAGQAKSEHPPSFPLQLK